LNFITPIKLRQ